MGKTELLASSEARALHEGTSGSPGFTAEKSKRAYVSTRHTPAGTLRGHRADTLLSAVTDATVALEEDTFEAGRMDTMTLL